MRFVTIILSISALMLYGRRSGPPPSNVLDYSWDSTKNWKIYKIGDFQQIFRIQSDSMGYLESRQLNDDSMHLFLSDAQKLTNMNPAWMGCYLASFETPDGRTRKAIISHYAGFFYCQPGNSYFQLNPSRRRDWLDYISNMYMSLNKKE